MGSLVVITLSDLRVYEMPDDLKLMYKSFEKANFGASDGRQIGMKIWDQFYDQLDPALKSQVKFKKSIPLTPNLIYDESHEYSEDDMKEIKNLTSNRASQIKTEKAVIMPNPKDNWMAKFFKKFIR
jgi:hypothetical protein